MGKLDIPGNVRIYEIRNLYGISELHDKTFRNVY
jgi:hypothetical protein